MFWLESDVLTWNAKIHGSQPIPPSVLAKFNEEMNITWGHVAVFGIKGNDLAIVGAGQRP